MIQLLAAAALLISAAVSFLCAVAFSMQFERMTQRGDSDRKAGWTGIFVIVCGLYALGAAVLSGALL